MEKGVVTIQGMDYNVRTGRFGESAADGLFATFPRSMGYHVEIAEKNFGNPFKN